jgi:RNA polymerase sigma factor (sigma-70 family)
MDGHPAAEHAYLPAPPIDREQLTAHYAWVRAVAQNLVRDPWGAEDVTQETLLAALAAPPRDVPDEQRLRAWLGRVAFNLSRLGARQGARRHAREVRVARQESLPSVSDELVAAGTIRALSEAITALDEPYRSVVVMRYFDGLSTAEIALRTETSELAVRKRLWRARNKLRDAIDHDPESGELLAGWLPFVPFARLLRSHAAAGLAAGVAVCTGVGVWLASDAVERAAPELTVAEAPAERQASLLGVLAPDEEEVEAPEVERHRTPLPELPPRAPGEGPGLPPRGGSTAEEAPVRLASVTVLDLEGNACAGLELHDVSAAPSSEAVVATSDAFGEVRLEIGAEARTLAARGPGLTTVAPARLAPGTEGLPHALVVAPAADLAARVVDESGRGLAGARLELRCSERAFAALPLPVTLASSELRTAVAEADGSASLPALARGAGLTLVVRASGFEPLERDTRALAARETFTLRAQAPESVLAGIVRHQGGRPAAGARVQLAEASVTSDDEGRFQLPLRGVRPDSSLQVSDGDKSAAPTTVRHFGARLASGLAGELELELGPERDPIDGKLLGDDAAGWLVAAFALDERPEGATEGDTQDPEEPVALTRSDATGAFHLALPSGAYDVYALDPVRPRIARATALDSRAGAWSLPLPPAAPEAGFRATLRGQDGQALAGAEVTLVRRLEREGSRRLAWRTLTSDAQGGLELPLDPALELEVGHAALGSLPALVRVGAGPEIVLAAPSFVRLSGASHARALRVLDEAGYELPVGGPLGISPAGSRAAFDLADGCSPALEVPAGARWVAIDAAEGEQRLPILPRAGAVLDVRP